MKLNAQELAGHKVEEQVLRTELSREVLGKPLQQLDVLHDVLQAETCFVIATDIVPAVPATINFGGVNSVGFTTT